MAQRMKSPCIEICRFDGTTGWCVGCGRTLPECREWKKASPYRVGTIARDLPRRMKALAAKGIPVGAAAAE
jgi:uncharacterized protein